MMTDDMRATGDWNFVQARSTGAGTLAAVIAAPAAGLQIQVRAYRAIGSGAGTVKLQDNAGTPIVLLAASDIGAFPAEYGPFPNARCTDAKQLDIVTTGAVNITHLIWYRVVTTNTRGV